MMKPSAYPILTLAVIVALCLSLTGCNKPSNASKATQLLEQAEANIHDGNLQEAFKQLSKALSADPNNTSMHVDLGWAYAMTGERAKALREIQIVESLSPKSPDLAYLKGYLYAQEQQWLDALEYYDDALNTDERNRPYLHADIADAFMQINEADAALKEYEVALRLDPENSRYEFGRCQAYRQLKQFDASIAACQQALMHVPEENVEERNNIDDVIEGMKLLKSLDNKNAQSDANDASPQPSAAPLPQAPEKESHADLTSTESAKAH